MLLISAPGYALAIVIVKKVATAQGYPAFVIIALGLIGEGLAPREIAGAALFLLGTIILTA